MKKISFMILAAIATVAAVSCTKESVIESETPKTPEEKVVEDVTFDVSFAKEDGLQSTWNEGDALAVFSEGIRNKFTAQAAGEAVVFKGDIALPSKAYYAIWPYRDSVAISGSVITSELPAAQISAENAYDASLIPAVAQNVEKSLSFKAVAGLISFSVEEEAGEVQSMVFKGNSGEKIAGKFSVDAKNAAVSGLDADQIEVKPAAAPFKTGTEYYVAMAPSAFAKGMSVLFNYADGKQERLVINESMKVEAGHVLDLGAIVPDIEADLSFAASFAADQAGKNVWMAGDAASVFASGANCKFTADGEGASAILKGHVIKLAKQYYALFPYSEAAAIEGSVISSEIPDVQTPVADAKTVAFAPAVAKNTAKNMEFSNIASVVSLNIDPEENEVVSLVFKGNDNEKIAGHYTVDVNDLKMKGADAESIELKKEGESLKNGVNYSFVAAPAELSKGFSVILTYKDGSFGEFKMNEAVSLKAGETVSYQNIKGKVSNLLINPGFEDGEKGWMAPAWNRLYKANKDQLISGKISLVFIGKPWIENKQTVKVEAGKTYKFGYTGKTSGACVINCRVDVAEGVKVALPALKSGMGLTTLEGEVTIPEGVTTVTFVVQRNKTEAPCWGAIDDTFFKEPEQ